MIRFDFEDKVDAYVISERQWPRTLRIAYYQTQLKQAATDEDKQFWAAVLRRNKD